VIGEDDDISKSFTDVIVATGDILAADGYPRALTAKTLVYLNLLGHKFDELKGDQVFDRIIYSTKLAHSPYLNDDEKFSLASRNADIDNIEQLVAAGANTSYAIELCTPDL
jgi:hypothetical protein